MPHRFGVGNGGSSGFISVSPSSSARGGDTGWHWVFPRTSFTQQRQLPILQSAASSQVSPHLTGICNYCSPKAAMKNTTRMVTPPRRGNPLRWVSVSSQDKAEVSNILYSHPLPLLSHRVRRTNLHWSLVETANCGYVKVSSYQLFFPWVWLEVNKLGTLNAHKSWSQHSLNQVIRIQIICICNTY